MNTPTTLLPPKARTVAVKALVVLVSSIVTLAEIIGVVPLQVVHALSGAEWSAGLIMDDGVFYNNGDMSVQSIQGFLNQKVPVCDTNGTQTSEYGGGTRAQYGTSRGYPPPYICVKDYYENPDSHDNNLEGRPIPAGALSAAQIFKAAADAYGISARVLIVMMQKESQGPLITDDWPFSRQYRNPMGYGCPDSAPCDPQYAGFYNQVMNAAAQFRTYVNFPNSFRLRAFQNNRVLYNTNTACGDSIVGIGSKATAGMYNYTPYQPDAAAVNNLYGSGDSCSSYGNRNFWRLFNDWFGTTRAVKLPDCPVNNNLVDCVWRLYNPANAEQFLTTSISERNSLVYNQGFLLESIAFFAQNASVSGAIPIYRISNPGLRMHLWTSSANERDVLVSQGWLNEGTAFYMNAAGASGSIDVYRLSYAPLHKHLWTTSTIERDNLVKIGYVNEGVVYGSPSTLVQEPAPPAGKVNMYRFSGLPAWEHFWTNSDAERDALIRYGFKYEGVSWYSQASPTNTPIYRLYSPSTAKHFWTTSAQERDILVGSGQFNLEGTVGYAADSTTSTPVYRLNLPGLKKHMWTTSISERDSLVANGYTYEGIAWYE